MMKECCTVDNQKLATADGSLSSTLNCLTCRTCGNQKHYMYTSDDPDNALFSYCRFAGERIKNGMPVFMSDVNEHSGSSPCSLAFDSWQFACDWYKVDEIEHHIARVNSPSLMEAADKAIPTDVRSREFAEWLAHQYRLAMCKGIQIGQSGPRGA